MRIHTPPVMIPMPERPPLAIFLPGDSLSPTFPPSCVSLAFVPSGQREELSRNEPQNIHCVMLAI